MTDDEQRRGRPNSPRLKTPAGPLRALVIGLLAARALSWHAFQRSVTVTVNAICRNLFFQTAGLPSRPAGYDRLRGLPECSPDLRLAVGGSLPRHARKSLSGRARHRQRSTGTSWPSTPLRRPTAHPCTSHQRRPSAPDLRLVTFNDSINYLPDPGQLELALCAMRENMADAGLLVFDLNTLLTYRTFFAERHVVEHGRRSSGRRSRADQASGSIARPLRDRGRGLGLARPPQCHFPEAKVRAALTRGTGDPRRARPRRRRGSRPLRELDHIKALYIARRR